MAPTSRCYRSHRQLMARRPAWCAKELPIVTLPSLPFHAVLSRIALPLCEESLGKHLAMRRLSNNFNSLVREAVKYSALIVDLLDLQRSMPPVLSGLCSFKSSGLHFLQISQSCECHSYGNEILRVGVLSVLSPGVHSIMSEALNCCHLLGPKAKPTGVFIRLHVLPTVQGIGQGSTRSKADHAIRRFTAPGRCWEC